MLLAFVLPCVCGLPAGRADVVRTAVGTTENAEAQESPDSLPAPSPARSERRRQARAAREENRRRSRSAAPQPSDSLPAPAPDSTAMPREGADTTARDTVRRSKKPGAFLDDMISGKNTDSLVYDVRNKTVYIYNEGDVAYQDMTLKGDYMRIDMNTKEIFAYGKADTVEGKPTVTHPVFEQGSASYTMDTITYNISSKKAKIKGVATQEGDGWLNTPPATKRTTPTSTWR